MSFRVGIGYDAHACEKGVPLWLGGVKIDSEFGLAGHSDGDVLIHAIVDAILGAAGLGDIGKHFSSDNPDYKDSSSVDFLSHVIILIEQSGWRVSNLDATIIAEQPKISTVSRTMVKIISGVLKIDESAVNIKGTTTDGMGFEGEGRGISASAITMIESKL